MHATDNGRQRDPFHIGWTAGFYDAVSDDGLRYRDELFRGVSDPEERRLLHAGYDAGKQSRRMLSVGGLTSLTLEAAA